MNSHSQIHAGILLSLSFFLLVFRHSEILFLHRQHLILLHFLCLFQLQTFFINVLSIKCSRHTPHVLNSSVVIALPCSPSATIIFLLFHLIHLF